MSFKLDQQVPKPGFRRKMLGLGFWVPGFSADGFAGEVRRTELNLSTPA